MACGHGCSQPGPWVRVAWSSVSVLQPPQVPSNPCLTSRPLPWAAHTGHGVLPAPKQSRHHPKPARCLAPGGLLILPKRTNVRSTGCNWHMVLATASVHAVFSRKPNLLPAPRTQPRAFFKQSGNPPLPSGHRLGSQGPQGPGCSALHSPRHSLLPR